MSRIPSGLWQNLIALQVYGANTNVGKTVFSTLLGAHFAQKTDKRKWRLQYIKPVSTGPDSDADDAYVKRHVKGATVTTLFQFKEPVSPHIAVRGAKFVPSDDHLIRQVFAQIQRKANKVSRWDQLGLTIVETAGGVLSPGPSGNPQADIYRSMRLPVILVGDHRLGGIASTISAAESLILRGYDISAVVCFDDKGKYENSEYLLNYFRDRKISAYSIPWIPQLEGLNQQQELDAMKSYYQEQSASECMHKLSKAIMYRHRERLATVNTLPARTREVIWHPFTQHKIATNTDEILVFDSAYGDFFQTKHTPTTLAGLFTRQKDSTKHNAMQPSFFPAFDGSASWWTQGLGHGNPKLSLAAAYAAGRYGHVMFAGATHEPAVKLAETLLEGMANPRLKKAFYTDDGSTAAEVGIKMALRATCKRYGWDGSAEPIGVLGLKGSYHGDTIGAMDASEPNVFNEKTDWYRGRGYWFDYPTVKMKRGEWVVEPPKGMTEQLGVTESFPHLDDIFNFEAREAGEDRRSSLYEKYIRETLDDLIKNQGRKFGALVMEPILLGAGGMIFVDPLFQRTLANVVRSYSFADVSPPSDPLHWAGLPILHDEVFTGLHRLGPFSSSSLLDIHPDISIHAKLLTGGLLPLSVTLASAAIFEAFLSPSKADALLHGHSYTAHPIGCHVANTSLLEMQRIRNRPIWRRWKEEWAREKVSGVEGVQNETSSMEGRRSMESSEIKEPKTWSVWKKDFVTWLSGHDRVEHVVALGSVLAISLRDASGEGYTSDAAAELRDSLLKNRRDTPVSVHSRVLGNVIYFMASLTARQGDLNAVSEAVGVRLGGWKEREKVEEEEGGIDGEERGEEDE